MKHQIYKSLHKPSIIDNLDPFAKIVIVISMLTYSETTGAFPRAQATPNSTVCTCLHRLGCKGVF